MHVIFRLLRNIVVDDVAYAGDVEPALGNVGGDEHADFPRLEILERAGSLALRFVGVHRRGGNSRILEMPDDAIGAVLSAGKNENRIHLRLLQQLDQQHRLSLARDRVNGVRNSADCLGATSDLHYHRLAQIRSRQGLDFGRHCRAEKKRLPIRRDLGHNPIELGRETHVEHSIGFIQHQNLEIIENDVLPLHVIEQPARSRDYDIHSGTKRLRLRLDADSAKNRDDAQRRVLAVLAEAFFDLSRELTRRRQDQHADAVKRRPLVVGDRRLDEIVNDGEREPGGFARTGLGKTNQIPTFQRQRNCLLLDRRGMRIPRIEHRVQHFGREIQLRKGDAHVDCLFTHLIGI